MSRFAAIVPLHGSKVDAFLVSRMRDSLRSPDLPGDAIWEGDGVTLLRTDRAIVPALAAIEGRVVLFDGRLDGRRELERTLRASGRGSDAGLADDSTLVGQAFVAWEESAPEHLLGDFSMLIWDRRAHEATLVRDRFGVRPLFHARWGETMLVTNDLASLLEVKELAAELYQPAIVDFLLFSGNQDSARTSYSAIHRVPPAHWLRVNQRGASRLQRYWSLPVGSEPRIITAADAVEEFRSLFDLATADRVRGQEVAISLSGGLDSTSVAAAAVRSGAAGVHAVTAGCERQQDEEASLARQTAGFLNIPWELAPTDHYTLFERWSDPHCRGLEPVDTPLRAAFVDLMARLAAHGRVLLNGLAGDSVLYSSHQHFVHLLRSGRWLRALRESSSYALTRRRWPPLLLRSSALRAVGLRSEQPQFPAWIRDEVCHRLNLRERWAQFWGWRRKRLHPWRPEAALFTQQVMWPNTFESYDRAWTGASLELTAPFLDIRLVEFLFTLPPMPHFADKDLLRQAAKGWVPEPVRLRPKTPLAVDPVPALLRREPAERAKSRMAAIESWVDPRILQAALERGLAAEGRSQQEIAARCLAEWLSFR